MKTADQILSEAAETFRERNKVYGNNYLRVGNAMQAFFPDGIKLESAHDHNRFHLFMLMVVKISRYAVNWEKGHQDSIRDAAVYAAMVEMVDGFSEVSLKETSETWKPKFKVGDEIRLIEEASILDNGRLPKGTLAFIREVPNNLSCLYKIQNTNGSWWMDEERMELVSRKTAKFKVGQKVKLRRDMTLLGDEGAGKKGMIGNIEALPEEETAARYIFGNSDLSWLVAEEDMEPA